MNKMKVIALAFGVCYAQKNVYSMNMNVDKDPIKHLQEIDLKTFTPPSEDKFREATAQEDALQAAILDIAFVTGVIYQGQVDFTGYRTEIPPKLLSLGEFKRIWKILQQRIEKYINTVDDDNKQIEDVLNSKKSDDINQIAKDIEDARIELDNSIVDFYRCFKIAPTSTPIDNEIAQETTTVWCHFKDWRQKVQEHLSVIDQNFKKNIQRLTSNS